MTDAEVNSVREEILEIFPVLSFENQQTLLIHARIMLAKEKSIKNTLKNSRMEGFI